MALLLRTQLRSPQKCPHMHLQGLAGKVEATSGYSLQCTDCWTFLEGPASLATIDRDPEGIMPAQDDWYLGKVVGHD